MSLQEFIDKYLRKQHVEFHSFGTGAQNQCVDLVNQYIKEVLGLTPIIGTNAKDFPTKYNKAEFDYIVNTPDAIIEAGDIPIWNGNVGGGAGHIAIATKKGTLDLFSSLDQNWSKVERVTLETHNYNNVIGWLRPKGGVDVNDREKKDLYWKWSQSLAERIGVTWDANNPQKSVDEALAKVDQIKKYSADHWSEAVKLKEELRVERTKTKGDPIAEKIRSDLKSWLA